MKKILIIIGILTALILSCTTANAAADSKLLSALEIFPETITGTDEPVTKAEFSYIAAKIMGSGERKPVNSQFLDVDESNEFSGYIQYLANIGIAAGGDDGCFNPESKITQETAYAIMIRCMGYGEYIAREGGYPDGCRKVAGWLGINKSIAVQDGFMTQKGVIGFIRNAVEVKYQMPVSPDDKITLLTDTLGINGYEATVTYADNSNYNITVRIERNLYDTNHNLLSAGSVVKYTCDGKIDINKYENAPVRIYTDSDDNVTAILLQKNVEVIYGGIYSVNGDDNADNKYASEYITSICFDGDRKKYKTAAKWHIDYNEKSAASPVALIGNFAKAVIQDGNIIYVSAWDLKDGGLITSVSDKELSYIKGTDKNARIKKLNLYTKKLVYIDGESIDMKRLKENTYFDWFEISEDTIVIVASEKVISDTFESGSDDIVEIGGNEYDRKSNIYIAGNDGIFRKNPGFSELFGTEVNAYFDYAGRCAYIRFYGRETGKMTSFLAAVDRCYNDEMDDEIDYIRVWVLEPEPSLENYKLAKRPQFNDGLTFDYLKAKAKKTDGSGVFEFTLNAKGEIKEISNPVMLPGFGSATATVTSIPDSNDVYVGVGGKTVFLNDAKITALYDDCGEFKAKNVGLDILRSTKVTNGATLNLYGRKDSLDIRLAVLSGAGLSGFCKSEEAYGFVSKKIVKVNDDNEIEYELQITGKSQIKLTVDEQTGKNIPSRAFVIYYKGAEFNRNSIIFDHITDMTGDVDEWTSSGILAASTVSNISDKAIMFTNGQAYFLHPFMCIYVEADDGMKNLKPIKASDINIGERVYYYAGAEVRAIIVVR